MIIASIVIGMDTAHAAPYDTYNGHYYVKVTGATWLDAQNDAKTNYGSQWNLVTINDAAENAWLSSTFSPGNNSSKLWIGYLDQGIGSGWEWVNGEVTGYENWRVNYPNNLGVTSYAAMNSSAKWESTPANAFFASFGIAESVAPEPLSAALFLIGGAGLVVARRKKKS